MQARCQSELILTDIIIYRAIDVCCMSVVCKDCQTEGFLVLIELAPVIVSMGKYIKKMMTNLISILIKQVTCKSVSYR